MEISSCCNSVTGHQIATNFCTCHDSTAVVPCTKFCSDHFIRREMRVKRNFHRIWNAMEKPLVKRGPRHNFTSVCFIVIQIRQTFYLLSSKLLQHDFCTSHYNCCPNIYVICSDMIACNGVALTQISFGFDNDEKSEMDSFSHLTIYFGPVAAGTRTIVDWIRQNRLMLVEILYVCYGIWKLFA